MSDHLGQHEKLIANKEPRAMRGAQARVVNSSCSGPRVLDADVFQAEMERLRPSMSAKAFSETRATFQKLMVRVMVTTGRGDIVNLNPFHEFEAAVQASSV